MSKPEAIVRIEANVSGKSKFGTIEFRIKVPWKTSTKRLDTTPCACQILSPTSNNPNPNIVEEIRTKMKTVVFRLDARSEIKPSGTRRIVPKIIAIIITLKAGENVSFIKDKSDSVSTPKSGAAE